MKRLICALVLSAMALAGAELTGKWTGSFDVTNSDGETKPDTAVLNLKEAGGTVTGTAGPNEEKQMEVKNGKLAGQKLTFEVTTEDGGVIRFTLVYDGETIKGDAAGEGGQGEKMTAKVNLKRA